MEDSDVDDGLPSLGDPFGLSLSNAIWLCGTAALVLTLFVLRSMGLLH